MTTQRVGIVTLDGFNEIDSFVAARMIHSVPDLEIELVGPNDTATSMAGVEVATPGALEELSGYDAVIVGSGFRTFEHIENSELMDRFNLAEPGTQLLGSQCSGAAFLHRLGRIDDVTICTDLMTAPKLAALGVSVANEPFRSNGKLATSGGCLSSSYLAFWMITQLVSIDAATTAMEYVSPVGEFESYLSRATRLTDPSRTAASAFAAG